VETQMWMFKVTVQEGVGPNPGSEIPGAELWGIYKKLNADWDYKTIDNLYNLPTVGVFFHDDNIQSYPVSVQITYDEAYESGDGIPVVFVADANEYYRGYTEATVPKTYISGNVQTENGVPIKAVAVKLDKIGDISWTADDVYRGAAGPVLRWSTTSQLYRTLFQIKTSVDVDTGLATGVWYIKRVTVAPDANTDYSDVDTIEVKIGEEIDLVLSPSDLPKTVRLDKAVEVTSDNPVSAEVDVYTLSGTASFTAGTPVVYITLEDLEGNQYQITVTAG